MALVRYLTHPQVQVDPLVDVPDWGLNEQGRARVAALVGCAALSQTTRVVSSTERKALDTARPIAAALGCSVEMHADMGENDRSATGFLPGPEFEAVADTFFANPDQSVRGWETAQDAQTRIVRAVEAALSGPQTGDILLVGHGAVGTLLWCHLMELPISRAHDQGPGGGGNWFAFDSTQSTPDGAWRPMETLFKP